MSKTTIEQKICNTIFIEHQDYDLISISQVKGNVIDVEKESIPALIALLDPEREKEIHNLKLHCEDQKAELESSVITISELQERNKQLESCILKLQKLYIPSFHLVQRQEIKTLLNIP
jgi:hypothetical protein